MFVSGQAMQKSPPPPPQKKKRPSTREKGHHKEEKDPQHGKNVPYKKKKAHHIATIFGGFQGERGNAYSFPPFPQTGAHEYRELLIREKQFNHPSVYDKNIKELSPASTLCFEIATLNITITMCLFTCIFVHYIIINLSLRYLSKQN